MNVDSRSETNSPRSEDLCILKMKLSSKYLMARTLTWLSVFGQHSANKSDVFNSLKPESLINRFIDTLQEHIKFLRVSLFYQEQEYVII